MSVPYSNNYNSKISEASREESLAESKLVSNKVKFNAEEFELESSSVSVPVNNADVYDAPSIDVYDDKDKLMRLSTYKDDFLVVPDHEEYKSLPSSRLN
jgi:hypothetical protein